MTYKVTDWAWELELVPVEKLTMVALADLANAAGQCWPSQALLARMTSTTDRTMRRVLVTLEGRRLITREHRYRPNGTRTSDLITLAYSAELQDNLSGSGGSTTGQHAEGLPDNTPEDYRTTVSGLVEPPVEPLENPQRAREAEFEAFWAVYPRHAGSSKADARKAYWRAVGKAGSIAVLGGAERFAKDPNLPTEQRFIPHASTWLNQERWDAEPLPSRGGTMEETAALIARARQRDLDEAAASVQAAPLSLEGGEEWR